MGDSGSQSGGVAEFFQGKRSVCVEGVASELILSLETQCV